MKMTFGNRIMVCDKCGNSRFKMVAETINDDDPLYECLCGNIIGPRFSIEAALRDEAHTVLRGHIVTIEDSGQNV